MVGGDASLETGASFDNSPLEMYTLTSRYHQDGDGEVLYRSTSGHLIYLFYLGMGVPVVPEEEAAGEGGGAELPRPLAHELLWTRV
jgi:hypothetical protein